jgi:release factor glutamine methyltransferase
MPTEVRQMVHDLADRFAAAGIESPRREAALLVAAGLGVDLAAVYGRPERLLTDEAAAAIDRLGRARAERQPLAYLIGRVDFCGLSFRVGPGVLVPRPDSECLVETALNAVDPNWEDPIRILDLCTGTGCIGISLARRLNERNRACLLALTESDPEAADYARQNLADHRLEETARLIRTDLFPPVDDDWLAERYHLIVGNPPYIPAGQIDDLMPEVSRYEPRQALNGGPDGLAFYRRIIEAAPAYLRDGGWLLLEHGFDQSETIAALLDTNGRFDRMAAVHDFGGNPRVSGGRLRAGAGVGSATAVKG